MATLELPEELLLQVFQLLRTDTLPGVILACRPFRRIAIPILYTDVVLEGFDAVIAFCRRVIAAGQDPVGHLVRSIHIYACRNAASPTAEVLVEARTQLVACVKLTPQLRSFVCRLYEGSLTRLELCISVCEIHTLEHLEFSASDCSFDTRHNSALDSSDDPKLTAPSSPPPNLKYLVVQDLGMRHQRTDNYDSLLGSIMSGPHLEEIVIRTVSVDEFLHPSWTANISSSLRALTVPSLSRGVLRVLLQCPHICSLTISDAEHDVAEIQQLQLLRDEKTATIPLETLRCCSQMLEPCTSLFDGLAYIGIDNATYPCDHKYDSPGWICRQGYCPEVLATDILSSVALYASTLRSLSFNTRDAQIIALADNPGAIPTFPVLETCVIGCLFRRCRATVSMLSVTRTFKLPTRTDTYI